MKKGMVHRSSAHVLHAGVILLMYEVSTCPPYHTVVNLHQQTDIGLHFDTFWMGVLHVERR